MTIWILQGFSYICRYQVNHTNRPWWHSLTAFQGFHGLSNFLDIKKLLHLQERIYLFFNQCRVFKRFIRQQIKPYIWQYHFLFRLCTNIHSYPAGNQALYLTISFLISFDNKSSLLYRPQVQKIYVLGVILTQHQ